MHFASSSVLPDMIAGPLITSAALLALSLLIELTTASASALLSDGRSPSKEIARFVPAWDIDL